MYKIPLFDLNYDHKELDAVTETIKSGWISTGPRCVEFADKFAQMLEVNHALTLSSCTTALHLAFKMIGIEEGDEVICPSLTFVATCNAIRYCGGKAVFADVESLDRPNISAVNIEKLITEKTKAIVVMHYAGFSCDMDAIMQLAKRHDLKVIEDACHGPMSEYKGRKLGTIGDIGCFSFFSNKNISTGEGGMLVTNNEEYFERAKPLRSHGMTTLSFQRAKGHATRYDVLEIGFNYRMDDIRASLGIAQLDKLMGDLEKRREIRKQYLKLFENINLISVPFKDDDSFSSNYIFPINLSSEAKISRDLFRERLHEKGVQTSIHYPPVHQFQSYMSDDHDLPNTEAYFNSSITLPMYSSLSDENLHLIARSVNEILADE